tara:strand:- start:1106 stop:1936 length:831 start_codon:yes stop_codon:yes gene_type:complete
MEKHNLTNIENYNKELSSNEYILFIKYIGLIHELIEYIGDNNFIQKNDNLKYIMIKGIQNIDYIYKILILYTNNLDLTIYHIQKCILYFIEFIQQINDNNFKLNTSHATLFIYEKTIFKINNEYKSSYKQSNYSITTLRMLDLYINLYNKIIFNIIKKFDFNIIDNQNINFIKFKQIIFINYYKIVGYLIKLPNIFNNTNIIENKIKDYIEFVDHINMICNKEIYTDKNIINYLNLITYIIKKGYTNNITNINIKNNIENIENIENNYYLSKIFNY